MFLNKINMNQLEINKFFLEVHRGSTARYFKILSNLGISMDLMDIIRNEMNYFWNIQKLDNLPVHEFSWDLLIR